MNEREFIDSLASLSVRMFFEHQQEISSKDADIARLREALKAMINTHGMHGPCKNHSCSSCGKAYKNAKQALKEGE